MHEEALIYVLQVEREAMRAIQTKMASQQLGHAFIGLDLEGHNHQHETDQRQYKDCQV